MAGIPARVAGIFTIMFGARLLKRTVCSRMVSLLRKLRGSVWMESRPLRPRFFSKAGRSSSAARTESSSMSFQPIWFSVADGISRISSAIRGFQVAISSFSAVRAITGLQVAPTAPWEMESVNSAIEAESFHRHVGVVCVICCSGLLYAVAAEVMTRERYQGREAGATALLPPLRTEMNFYWGDRAGAPC